MPPVQLLLILFILKNAYAHFSILNKSIADKERWEKLTKLFINFLVLLPVNGVVTLDVINKTEVFSGFLDLDDIHETSRESGVGADFAVNLKKMEIMI